MLPLQRAAPPPPSTQPLPEHPANMQIFEVREVGTFWDPACLFKFPESQGRDKIRGPHLGGQTPPFITQGLLKGGNNLRLLVELSLAAAGPSWVPVAPSPAIVVLDLGVGFGAI